MSATFLSAFVILLREGLEALLVLAALSAYLIKSGARDRLGALYAGALAAIVASLIVAWIFQSFNDGQHNDLVEAFVILAAAALMLYVSGWLFVRQDPRVWQAYLHQHADGALAKGTALAVAALAFLAVFREGAETVLFLHALAGTSGGWTAALIGGIAAGFAALIVLFFVINFIAERLPLRPLFLITSAFLFVMALKFIGDAILEFQEQLIVSSTPVISMIWLMHIGFNPTREALLAQGAVLLLSLISFVIWQRSASTTTQGSAEVR